MEIQQKLETSLQYIYILSVALSPLGPVFHYSLWGVCAVLIVWRALVDKASLRVNLPPLGKNIFLLLTAFTLWSIFVSLLTFTGVQGWGRNATVPLEMWLGMYLAARTLNSPESRGKFVKIFVAVSAIILLGNVLRAAQIISYFPNNSLRQSNSIGALALLLFPTFSGYVLWSLRDSPFKKLLATTVVGVALIISFSSGAWLGAASGGIVLLWYSLKYRKLHPLFCVVAAVMIVAVCAGVNVTTHGRFYKDFIREITQITSVDNIDRLTTGRNRIWRAAKHLISERPLTGQGGSEFELKYIEVYKKYGKALALGNMDAVDHPHSTYLYLAYIGGLPALAIFLLAMLLALKKSITLANDERNVLFPWGVTIAMLIVVILVYGTNGDIFQGRRDISVMVWCIFGVLCVMKERNKS